MEWLAMASIAPSPILVSPILVILDLNAVLTMILERFNAVHVQMEWLAMVKSADLSIALVTQVLVILE